MGVELLNLRLQLRSNGEKRAFVGLHPAIPTGARGRRQWVVNEVSLSLSARREVVKKLRIQPQPLTPVSANTRNSRKHDNEKLIIAEHCLTRKIRTEDTPPSRACSTMERERAEGGAPRCTGTRRQAHKHSHRRRLVSIGQVFRCHCYSLTQTQRSTTKPRKIYRDRRKERERRTHLAEKSVIKRPLWRSSKPSLTHSWLRMMRAAWFVLRNSCVMSCPNSTPAPLAEIWRPCIGLGSDHSMASNIWHDDGDGGGGVS